MSALTSGGVILALYGYLGESHVVRTSHPEPNIATRVYDPATDSYSGHLDRFGRIALYLRLGALLPTACELNARGWTTKAGGAWSNTSLHSFLTSPLYAGKIRAGSEVVEGQQDAIVDLETFGAVQLQLSRRAAVPRGWRPPKRDGALLAGLLKCVCGSSMIRSSTKKDGRRYFSYVCGRVLKHGAAACPGSRAPAGELETFVLERVRAVGRDPAVMRATLAADRHDPEELRRALAEFDPLWGQLSPPERARVLALLLERVTFDAESGEVELKFRPGGPRLLTQTTCPQAGAVPANGQANH